MSEIYHVAVKLTDVGPSVNMRREKNPIAMVRDDDGVLVFTREQAANLGDFLTIVSAETP